MHLIMRGCNLFSLVVGDYSGVLCIPDVPLDTVHVICVRHCCSVHFIFIQ